MKHSTLFLDESGKANLLDQKYNEFLISGVILNDSDISTLDVIFSYVKRKYKITLNKPFHAYHIFENPSTKLPDTVIKELIQDMNEFLSYTPLKIKLIYLLKNEFRTALGIKNDSDLKGNAARKSLIESPYHVISCRFFNWYASYLERRDSIGQIVTDSRQGGDYELLRTLNLCKNPGNIFNEKISRVIKSRCTAICFADKTFLSAGLEITDLVSYVSYLFLRGLLESNTVYKSIFGNLWQTICLKADYNKIYKVNQKKIKDFYGIKKGGIHKYLN